MTFDCSQLRQVWEIAIRAGEEVLNVYRAHPSQAEVAFKKDATPLTRADRRSHEVILSELRKLTPQVDVISEEDDPAARRQEGDGLRWVVDPLDGTKEFIKRTGEFTVNIALVLGNTPIAGVVHAPALGVSWLGANGEAERRTDGASTAITTRIVSDVSALCIVASRDHAGAGVRELLDRVPGASTLSVGSSLKFCLIAEGAADLYYRDGPTMEWDTAAAHAVLRAAGGEVYTLDGRPLKYGKPELRNPHFVAVGSPDWDWRSVIEPTADKAS